MLIFRLKRIIILFLAIIILCAYIFKVHLIKVAIKQNPVSALSLTLLTKDENLIRQIKSREYFPKNIFDSYSERDEFLATWFGMHMNSMDKTSLWKQHTKKNYIYRFLYLPSFDSPYLIRIEINKDGDGLLVVKSTDGAGGFAPGVITKNEMIKLTKNDVSNFLQQIDKIHFWETPTKVPDLHQVDGSRWIIEGIKLGKYHIVERQSSDRKDFVEMSEIFKKIAREKEDAKEDAKVPVTF